LERETELKWIVYFNSYDKSGNEIELNGKVEVNAKDESEAKNKALQMLEEGSSEEDFEIVDGPVKAEDGYSIGNWDLRMLNETGFTIKQMREYLNENFRDSFKFEVYEPKPGTQAAELIPDHRQSTVEDNRLSDMKFLFPTERRSAKTRSRGLIYRVYQGGENTYFDFMLIDEKVNGYIGTFGFKDQGDVSPEYITRFVAFLHEAYGFPFTIKHTIAKDGKKINIVYDVTYFDKDGEQIDQTQIDEKNEVLAWELFAEFGHTKEPGMYLEWEEAIEEAANGKKIKWAERLSVKPHTHEGKQHYGVYDSETKSFLSFYDTEAEAEKHRQTLIKYPYNIKDFVAANGKKIKPYPLMSVGKITPDKNETVFSRWHPPYEVYKEANKTWAKADRAKREELLVKYVYDFRNYEEEKKRGVGTAIPDMSWRNLAWTWKRDIATGLHNEHFGGGYSFKTVANGTEILSVWNLSYFDKNGKLIGSTQIDEKSEEFAWDLFEKQLGHTKEPGMYIEWEEETDPDEIAQSRNFNNGGGVGIESASFKVFKQKLEGALFKKYAVMLKDTGFDDTHVKLAIENNEEVGNIVSQIGHKYELTPVSAAGQAVEKNNSSSNTKASNGYICILKDRTGKEIGSYDVTRNDDEYINSFLNAIGVKLKPSDTKEIVEAEVEIDD
jgi:hypothetical protein